MSLADYSNLCLKIKTGKNLQQILVMEVSGYQQATTIFYPPLRFFVKRTFQTENTRGGHTVPEISGCEILDARSGAAAMYHSMIYVWRCWHRLKVF